MAKGFVYRRMALSATCLAAALYITLPMYNNIPILNDKFRVAADASVVAPYFDYLLLLLTVIAGVLTFNRWREFLRHPYFKWCVLIVAVYGVNLFRLLYLEGGISDEEITDAEDTFQRSVLFLSYGYLLMLISRARMELFLRINVIVVPALILYDFFNPAAFTVTELEALNLRASGPFLNANIAAEAALLCLVLTFRRLKGTILLIAMLLAGAAVLSTFSRSGILAWMILSIYILFYGRVSRAFIALPILAVISYSTLILYAEDFLGYVFDNTFAVERLVDRLSFFGDVGDAGVVDSSAEERIYIAAETLDAAIANPVFGNATTPQSDFGVSAHNLYLEFWYTYGLGGLLIVFAAAWLLNKFGRRDIFGLVSLEAIVFLVFSFFNHTLLSHNIWLIFIAAAIAGTSVLEAQVSAAQMASRRMSFSDFLTAVKLMRFRRRKRKGRRRRSGKHDIGSFKGRFDG